MSVLTAAEAAAVLRLSEPTVRKLCRLGKLPVAIERPLRLSRAAVERLAARDDWEPMSAPPPAPEKRPTPIRHRPAAGAGHDVADMLARVYRKA